MGYGISNLSIIPMRKDRSERSEMVSQLIFGELYEVLEEEKNWVYIKGSHDEYCGWIDGKMHMPVSETFAREYISYPHPIAKDTLNIIKKPDDYGNKLIVSGSIFPFFDKTSKRFRLDNETYELVNTMKTQPEREDIRETLIGYAMQYYNTPYLWGGRTPYGIDCSGFAQIVYRLAGIKLPRDAYQQAGCGTPLSFLQEAKPGDLAFFGDNEHITHVGILWKGNRIIHASGKVRIDKIDHNGIFNEELNIYSHNLLLIRSLF